MKLRKIDSRRFCDDETGTYFEFPLETPASVKDAEAMVQADMECHLSNHPQDGYLDGRERKVFRLGRIGR
jgi:hypothetical protein